MRRNKPLTDADRTRQLFRLRSAIADLQRGKDGQEPEPCDHEYGEDDMYPTVCWKCGHDSGLEAPDLITGRPTWPKGWGDGR